MFSVVDLFAGCGGLSLGFEQAGFNVDAAVEFDASAAKTFAQNFPRATLLAEDIANVNESHLLDSFSPDVLVGGPPCQGFSMAGSRNRGGFTDDPRNYLFKHYLEVVDRLRPKVFVMENVKGMLSMQGGRVFEEILAAFSDSARFGSEIYALDWRVVNARDFGLPQHRERLMIVGVRGEEFKLESHWDFAHSRLEEVVPGFFDDVRIVDALGGMPYGAADGLLEVQAPLSRYQTYLSDGSGVSTSHRPSNHSADAVRRMKMIAPGENYMVLNETIRSVHSGSYGRLRWDDKAPTITTRFDTPAGGRFTHPEFHRTLTPREASRIQGFPDGFVFAGDNRSVSRQIGNAVPPKLARFFAEIARSILSAPRGGEC